MNLKKFPCFQKFRQSFGANVNLKWGWEIWAEFWGECMFKFEMGWVIWAVVWEDAGLNLEMGWMIWGEVWG